MDTEIKFVGITAFKKKTVKYLNAGNEIVVMRHKKPIARLTPLSKKSSETALLEIGKVFTGAGISKKEMLKALERVRQRIYG